MITQRYLFKRNHIFLTAVGFGVRRWFVFTQSQLIYYVFLPQVWLGERTPPGGTISSSVINTFRTWFRISQLLNREGRPSSRFVLPQCLSTHCCVFLHTTACCLQPAHGAREDPLLLRCRWGEPAPRPLLLPRSSSKQNALISAQPVEAWFLSSPLWRAFPEVRAPRRRAFTSGSGRS